MIIETLKSPKKSKKSEQYFRDKIEIFIRLFYEHFARHFKSHWRKTWRHTGRRTVPQISLKTPPPPPPARDLYFCEYYALPSRIYRDLFTRMVQVRLLDYFWRGSLQALNRSNELWIPLMWLWIRDRPLYLAGDYFPHSGFFSVAQNVVYVCLRVVRRSLRFIVLIRED